MSRVCTPVGVATTAVRPSGATAAIPVASNGSVRSCATGPQTMPAVGRSTSTVPPRPVTTARRPSGVVSMPCTGQGRSTVARSVPSPWVVSQMASSPRPVSSDGVMPASAVRPSGVIATAVGFPRAPSGSAGWRVAPVRGSTRVMSAGWGGCRVSPTAMVPVAAVPPRPAVVEPWVVCSTPRCPDRSQAMAVPSRPAVHSSSRCGPVNTMPMIAPLCPCSSRCRSAVRPSRSCSTFPAPTASTVPSGENRIPPLKYGRVNGSLVAVSVAAS